MKVLTFFFLIAVVTEFIEGLVETYPGLQYLDGFPEVIIQDLTLYRTTFFWFLTYYLNIVCFYICIGQGCFAC